MTIEELRNFLNTLVEEYPEIKDKEVKIQYWDTDETFGDEYIAFDSALSVSYSEYKQCLVIDGETI